MDELNKINSTLDILENERAELAKRVNPMFIWMIVSSLAFCGFLMGLFQSSQPLVFGLVVSFFVSAMIYEYKISQPFDRIKSGLKSALLREFMSIYHPDVTFDYQMEAKQGYSIIRSSKLISADKYNEEDVVHGDYNGTDFYISEVHLKNKSKNSSRTVFKGILFKIKIPSKNYPKTRIQSRPGLLKQLWHDYKKNDEYGFYTESQDHANASRELKDLFPFIQHLIKEQGDIRMHIEGDEIILLMQSDMKLLDDPPPKISKPLNLDEYKLRMGRQINSLLFIVEALTTDLKVTEMEERLELKALELMKKPIELRLKNGDD